MKLRYIKLGAIDPVMNVAIWEFSRIATLNGDGILFDFTFNKPNIELTNTNIDPRIDLKLENLPDGMELHRSLQPFPQTGIFFHNLDSVGLTIHLPQSEMKNIRDGEIVYDLVYSLREAGVKCFVNDRNDMSLMQSNGAIRKFCGRLGRDWDNGYRVITIGISLTIDYDLINNIYNFSKGKVALNNITNIRDVIIGLKEEYPTLDFEKIKQNYIERFCVRKEFELVPSVLTSEEQEILDNLSKTLNNDKWVYDSIHPVLGK